MNTICIILIAASMIALLAIRKKTGKAAKIAAPLLLTVVLASAGTLAYSNLGDEGKEFRANVLSFHSSQGFVAGQKLKSTGVKAAGVLFDAENPDDAAVLAIADAARASGLEVVMLPVKVKPADMTFEERLRDDSFGSVGFDKVQAVFVPFNVGGLYPGTAMAELAKQGKLQVVLLSVPDAAAAQRWIDDGIAAFATTSLEKADYRVKASGNPEKDFALRYALLEKRPKK